GTVEKLQQQIPTLGARQIQSHRTLVAVDADEIGGIIFMERRSPVPYLVALRRLNLDNLGAVIGEDLTAVGSAQDAGQVDDLLAPQSAARLRRRIFAVVHLQSSFDSCLLGMHHRRQEKFRDQQGL